ncbi:hypothetical protein [Vibrio phage vB_VaS_L1]|nr:hypothetical protein [Vibrio phage vB_VaS_L1]
MSLKVVDPINVTDAVLTASDIPEPDTARGEVEWDGETFFGLDVSSIIPFGYQIMDMVIAFDGFRILAGNPGAVMTMYHITTAGVLDKSYSMPSDTLSFVAYDGKHWAVRGDGNIYEHNQTDGGLIDTHPISPEVTKASAIGRTAYTNLYNFVVYDYEKEAVFGFDQSVLGAISYANFTFEVTGAGRSIDGIELEQNEMYLKQLKTDNTIKKYSLSGKLEEDIVLQDGLGSFAIDVQTKIPYMISYLEDKKIFYYDENFEYETAYKEGDEVILVSNHTKYRALKNTSDNPIDGATEDAAASWIKVGPTNKWGMFDDIVQTKTLSDTDFTITLNPTSYANTLGALGFYGVTSIRVEVDDNGGSPIYDKTFTTADFSTIYDHYTYVFYQIVNVSQLIVTDLPALPGVTMRITFSGTDMGIGEVVHGFATEVGTLVAEGTKSDRFRYREQQYNDFGFPVGAEPITVELNTYDVLVKKSINPAIQKLLNGLTGRNTLWIGDIGSDQILSTYGFFERSPIPFAMPNDINYQITVRASV